MKQFQTPIRKAKFNPGKASGNEVALRLADLNIFNQLYQADQTLHAWKVQATNKHLEYIKAFKENKHIFDPQQQMYHAQSVVAPLAVEVRDMYVQIMNLSKQIDELRAKIVGSKK